VGRKPKQSEQLGHPAASPVLKSDIGSVADQVRARLEHYRRAYEAVAPDIESALVLGFPNEWTTCSAQIRRAAQLASALELPGSPADPGAFAQERAAQLDSIPLGDSAANEYHSFIAETLEWVLYPQLSDLTCEQKINEGRKRIDIVADNVARGGFFEELAKFHRVVCPHIMIECKNYSRDIGNPEIDQLLCRLSPKRGQFGILVCRQVADPKALLNRCKDARQDDKVIIVLADKDIKELMRLRAVDGEAGVDRYLRRKMRELI
jgi:hypothetical protein